MEATLLIKDTLDITMRHDSFFHGEYPIVLCNSSLVSSDCCVRDIWITGIICLTIFLLIVSTLFMILWYKKGLIRQIIQEEKCKNEEAKAFRESQHEIEIEKEKSRYRERLANFIESQAKGLTKSKEEIYAFNDQISEYYVEELKSYIKGLAPTETQYIFQKKDKNNTESPND